jgi:tetratricopeptide (TPR) repeat protein
MIVSQSGGIMKDEALFNLGRLYAAMGENEKSLMAFKKIISDYSDSIYVELARERVSG